MPKYQALIQNRPYDVTAADLEALDATGEFDSRRLHLLHEQKGYRVELLGLDRRAKTVRLSVNGRAHTVHLRDEVDQLVDRLGFASAEQTTTLDAHAPMPGLVLEVLVSEGQEVTAGTPLLILEAMKMENVIKAGGAGTVRSLRVSQGEAVEKKQLLLEIS